MKELTGHASATTHAAPAACMALLEAIDGYPTWSPDIVKEAEVLKRDAGGRPTQARAKLHVERGPLTREFNLVFDMRVEPAGRIDLRRIPHEASDQERFDVTWTVDGGRIRLELAANLDVPRFIPLGGVGDALAEKLVSDATRRLGRS